MVNSWAIPGSGISEEDQKKLDAIKAVPLPESIAPSEKKTIDANRAAGISLDSDRPQGGINIIPASDTNPLIMSNRIDERYKGTPVNRFEMKPQGNNVADPTIYGKLPITTADTQTRMFDQNKPLLYKPFEADDSLKVQTPVPTYTPPEFGSGIVPTTIQPNVMENPIAPVTAQLPAPTQKTVTGGSVMARTLAATAGQNLDIAGPGQAERWAALDPERNVSDYKVNPEHQAIFDAKYAELAGQPVRSIVRSSGPNGTNIKIQKVVPPPVATAINTEYDPITIAAASKLTALPPGVPGVTDFNNQSVLSAAPVAVPVNEDSNEMQLVKGIGRDVASIFSVDPDATNSPGRGYAELTKAAGGGSGAQAVAGTLGNAALALPTLGKSVLTTGVNAVRGLASAGGREFVRATPTVAEAVPSIVNKGKSAWNAVQELFAGKTGEKAATAAVERAAIRDAARKPVAETVAANVPETVAANVPKTVAEMKAYRESAQGIADQAAREAAYKAKQVATETAAAGKGPWEILQTANKTAGDAAVARVAAAKVRDASMQALRATQGKGAKALADVNARLEAAKIVAKEAGATGNVKAIETAQKLHSQENAVRIFQESQENAVRILQEVEERKRLMSRAAPGVAIPAVADEIGSRY